MSKFSIRQNGKKLKKSKYSIDLEKRVFKSEEDNLVLDFYDLDDLRGWSFETGSDCIFNTGCRCDFKTGDDCIFKTSFRCDFKTGANCTFKTGAECGFKTGADCTFNTKYGCKFKTRHKCTFNTGSGCRFKTMAFCTFKTGCNCIFKNGLSCTFLILDVSSQKFKIFDVNSIILDAIDQVDYKLKDLKPVKVHDA